MQCYGSHHHQQQRAAARKCGNALTQAGVRAWGCWLSHLVALSMLRAHNPRRGLGRGRAVGGTGSGGGPHLLVDQVQRVCDRCEMGCDWCAQRWEFGEVQLPLRHLLHHGLTLHYWRHRGLCWSCGWLGRCTSHSRARGAFLLRGSCSACFRLRGFSVGRFLALLGRLAERGARRARRFAHHCCECTWCGRCSRCSSRATRLVVEYLVI